MSDLDHTFTAVLQGDMGPHKWTCAILPGSASILGTGKSVRVTAEIGGVSFDTSMLPYRGDHMLPVKQAVLTETGLAPGDPVTVRITRSET